MFRGIRLTVAVFLLLFMHTTTSAHLSYDEISCSIFKELHPTGVPKRLDFELLPNGLLGELYDVNQDGAPDVAVYTPSYGQMTEVAPGIFEPLHSDIPTFYELDLVGNDRKPDVIYIDIYGTKKCIDFKLYAHITTSREHPPGFVIRWDGINAFGVNIPHN